MKVPSVVALLSVVLGTTVASAQRPASDRIPAAGGDITIIPIAHGSVYVAHGQNAVLVDPVRFSPSHPPPEPTPEELAALKNVPRKKGEDPPAEATSAVLAIRPGQMALFEGLRAATLILITDVHDDHLDGRAIGVLKTPTTRLIVPPAAIGRLFGVQGAEAMANGARKSVSGMTIEAVPMYNVRPDPQFGGAIFHTKGRGNGYVVTIGGKRLYFAGDTACTPEMRALTDIDVAFLPMNLPFTMPPSEAADCAKAFKPKIVYPYHYFESDPKEFATALKGSGIEVRLRNWY